MQIISDNDYLVFLNSILKPFSEPLYSVQKKAMEDNIPIIPNETAKFLSFLLGILKPKNILEIGTAVGFSAGLFSLYTDDDAKITTIDRYDIMIQEAKKNFKLMEIEDKVELLEGDACDILQSLNMEYDFIFLDAAKAQYINFLPNCLRLLKTNGILVADDVLAAGDVIKSRYQIPKRQRTTHKRIRNFLYEITSSKELDTCIIPIGGGLALSRKL